MLFLGFTYPLRMCLNVLESHYTATNVSQILILNTLLKMCLDTDTIVKASRYKIHYFTRHPSIT